MSTSQGKSLPGREEAPSFNDPVPLFMLKDFDSSKDAHRNIIVAARLIAGIIRSALGPRSMDKMLVDSLGEVTITNDGLTILKEVDIEHPVGKMMVEVARTADKVIGDGTKSIVILTGALMEQAEELINMGMSPITIVNGFRKASARSIEILNSIAEKVSINDRNTLIKIVNTSIQSKFFSEQNTHLSEIIVDAVLHVVEKRGENYRVDIDNVHVEKKEGGSIRDTKLIRGMVLDKEVVHGLMKKRVDNALIALLSVPFMIYRRKDGFAFTPRFKIDDPKKMKAIMGEEDRMLREMVDKVVQSGANVVICQRGMKDIVRDYLAQAGLLAIRRVTQPNMIRLAKATGGNIVTNFRFLSEEDLGRAGLVEERAVGIERWIFIEECNDPKAVTVMIRGGTKRVVEEVERSVHDALMVLKAVIEKPSILAGGGSSEAYTALRLREWANTISGREQLAIQKFTDVLETIPLVLAENAGMDPIDTITELRSRQTREGKWMGIDARDRGIVDMMKKGIVEPLLLKRQIIKAATEVASAILRIDMILAKPKKEGRKEQPHKIKGLEVDKVY